MPQADTQSELLTRFQVLLGGYATHRKADDLRLQTAIAGILPRFLEVRELWAKAQQKTADEFNLFEIMELDGDEVCHSKMLAWLLDHRIERGTHAQGNLGFKLFLDEVGDELRATTDIQVSAYATEPYYWVRSELSGDESRIDIEIAASGKFLIHIENKIFSAEGNDQTNREWRDLQARRKELAVPELNCHAIFLTLDWSKATNENFLSIGWNRIANVLDRFASQAEPHDVQLFARHYAKAVRKLNIVEPEEEEYADL